jgi:RNase P/RNase MRP subunit POP5
MVEKKSVSTIPLSMRGKKRYILFTLSVENVERVAKEDFSRALKHHLLHCFGVLGLPLHRVKLIVFDSNSGKGILRCAHTSKDSIITSLSLWNSFNGKPSRIRSTRTSGTLKTLRPGFYTSSSF